MRYLPTLAGLLAIASQPMSAGLMGSAGWVPHNCTLCDWIACQLGDIGCSLDVYGTEFTAKGFSFAVTAAGGGIVPGHRC